jgi:hypothetical protein
MKLLGLLLLIALASTPAEVVDMSGTWVLNKDRSDWNKKSPPTGVILHIEHREPSFKYNGKVVEGGTEKDDTQFSFEGAIDGKEYLVTEASGAKSRIRLKRVSADTISSVLIGTGGKTLQEATTTISSDRKTLVRKIKQRNPDNTTGEWTEIYEKR